MAAAPEDSPFDMTMVFRSMFNSIDTDNSGSLSKAELNDYLRKEGYMLTWSEFEELFKSIDTDDSGELSFDEFVKAIQQISFKQSASEQPTGEPESGSVEEQATPEPASAKDTPDEKTDASLENKEETDQSADKETSEVHIEKEQRGPEVPVQSPLEEQTSATQDKPDKDEKGTAPELDNKETTASSTTHEETDNKTQEPQGEAYETVETAKALETPGQATESLEVETKVESEKETKEEAVSEKAKQNPETPKEEKDSAEKDLTKDPDQKSEQIDEAKESTEVKTEPEETTGSK